MDDSISRQSAIGTLKMDVDIIPFTKAREYVRAALDTVLTRLEELPSAQPEITDEQAIEHLTKSGWMQNHDKQMYEVGLRERLADDSGSYDALLPPADSISKEDVLGWLLAYHTMSFDLKGRYYPHEVIGWLVADISKNLFAEIREENNG